eukprot:6217204-Prymnesium_polylepis.1
MRASAAALAPCASKRARRSAKVLSALVDGSQCAPKRKEAFEVDQTSELIKLSRDALAVVMLAVKRSAPLSAKMTSGPGRDCAAPDALDERAPLLEVSTKLVPFGRLHGTEKDGAVSVAVYESEPPSSAGSVAIERMASIAVLPGCRRQCDRQCRVYQ